MTIWDFLRELEFFYKYTGNDNDKNRLFSSYVENLEGICIANKCEYDWKKVLQAIQKTYTYSKFPPLADIIKCLPEGKIYKTYTPCKDEGSLIVLTLPDERKYYFTASAIGRALDKVKEEITLKYGDCHVEMYPKGTVVIGNSIVLP